MALSSVADIRSSWGPAWADASDEEVLSSYAKAAKLDPVYVANTLGYDLGKGSLTNERVSASKDNYDANLYGLGESIANKFNATGAADWMRSGRRDNEFQANVASGRARALGGIDSIKDVHGLGDFANYAGGGLAQMLPYAAEAAVGGLAVRGLSTGLRGAMALGRAEGATAEAVQAAAAAQKAMSNRALAGGVAASYPSSVADILGNQRDQLRSNGLDDGRTDLLSAAIGGVPYAALNALSPSERLLTTGGIGRGLGLMDNMTGVGGAAARLGVNMTGATALEGANETGQELINQRFGRMAVDPNETQFNGTANDRYLESFAGGATVGGLMGGAAGGWRRSNRLYEDQRTQDLLAANRARDENALRNMVGPPGPLVGPDNTLVLDSYGQDTGPQYARADASQIDGFDAKSYADLVADLQNAQQYVTDAEKSGRPEMLAQARGYLQEISRRLAELGGRQQGQREVMSGVHEMVSGRPVELTNDELARNMLPFMGGEYDPNVGTSAGAPQRQGGLDYEYTPITEAVERGAIQRDGGLDSYGPADGPQYRPNGVAPQTPTASVMPGQYDLFNPNGTPTYGADSTSPMLDVADAEARLNGALNAGNIDRALGIGRPGYAGRSYPKQFEAAASEPTGEVLSRTDRGQVESPVTALEAVQRQAGLIQQQKQEAQAAQAAKQRVQAIDANTAQRVAQLQQTAKEAEALGIKGTNAIAVYDRLITEAQDLGLSPAVVSENVALLRVGRYQQVKKYLDAKAQEIDQRIAAEKKRQEDAQALVDKLRTDHDAKKSAAQPVTGQGAGGSQPTQQVTPTQNTAPAPMPSAPVATETEAPTLKPLYTVKQIGTDSVELSHAGTGQKKIINKLHWDRARKVLGMDEDGYLTEDPISAGEVGRQENAARVAAGQLPFSDKANRARIGKSLKALGLGQEQIDSILVDTPTMDSRASTEDSGTQGTDGQRLNTPTDDRGAAMPVYNGDGQLMNEGVISEQEVASGMRLTTTAAKATNAGQVGGLVTGLVQVSGMTPIPTVQTKAAAAYMGDPKGAAFFMHERFDWIRLEWPGQTPIEELPVDLQMQWVIPHALADDFGRTLPDKDKNELYKRITAAAQEGASTPEADAGGVVQRGGSGQDVAAGDAEVRADDAGPARAGGRVGSQTESAQADAAKGPDKSGSQAPVTQDSGQTLWEKLRTASPDLSHYDDLTENERGFLTEFADENGVSPKIKGTPLEDLVGDHLPGGALYSKSAAKAPGSQAAQVLAEIKKMMRLDALNSKVMVVQSVADLPQGVQKSVNVDADTQGFVVNGKAYLVADNIAPGKARSVFLHEVGAHLGLENLLGKAQFAALVGKIKQWASKADGSQESKLAQAAQQRATDAGTSAAQTDTELLAYFIEEAVDAGVDPTATKPTTELGRWFRTLWAAFKTALHRLKVNPDKLTAQDVVDMAYGAAKLESTGAFHGAAAQFRKFDHKYMGTGEGAQAFGWGSYFAQAPGIAKGYWKTDVANKRAKSHSPSMWVLDNEISTAKSALAESQARWDRGPTGPVADLLFAELEQRKAYLSDLEKMLKQIPEGALYRVDFNVADDEWLDLDKPLSEQSEKVKAAMKDAAQAAVGRVEEKRVFMNGPIARGGARPKNATVNNTPATDMSVTGREAYDALSGKLGSDKAASEYLDSIGIKGNRFLDANSRTPPHNYVVRMDGQDIPLDILNSMEEAGVVTYDSDTSEFYVHKNHSDTAIAALRDSYVADDAEVPSGVEYAFRYGIMNDRRGPKNPTSNFVVFNDKNIQRVASEIAADRDRVKFSKAKPVTMQSVVRDVPTAITELTDYLKMGRDAVAIRGMFTEDLVNLAAKVIPAAKGYLSAMKTIQAKRGAAERTVESVLNQFSALSSSERGTGPGSVNAFLKESTFDGKWAFEPDWLPKGSVKVDDGLAQRFDEALSKPAQDVVKAVLKHGHTSLQEMKKAALAMHASEYDVLIAEAAKAGDTKEVAKLTRQKIKSMKEFQSLFAIHEFKPYAPLKRFGNYVVLATSARYKAAHAAGDTKTMQELQSDGAHYHVEFAETPWAAKKLVADLTPKFPDGFVAKMEKSDDSMMMGGRDTLAAFGRLRKAIKENTDDELMGIDRKTAARMDDMMRQMYLTLLSEVSARKSEIHRKNVAGADGDMMRAFATQGRATAHFIAGLQTSGQVDDHIASMREQTRKLDTGPQREERQKYLNEIMRRHSMGLEYHPSPFIDKLMSSSSVMMLLTNPAYHVMNALQPGLMTQPLLAARHGYFKSWNELRRAYTDLGPILKSAKFDETSYAKLPKDVQQAISDLADKGVIDIMMDADLGRFESVPDSALRGVSIVTEKLRHIAQNVEAMNRLSSAIAAYRLEKTKGNATHQSAVDYAAKVIYESHGDYSGFNAPRFMRNDIGRVLTQFRKFQLIQLSLVTREFHRAFFGESAEVKTAGRYALAYTLSHILATAGVMGLPGAAAIGWALGKLTPDDEPDDPEATLRRLIGNKQAADLLIKGAPKAFGVDLSRTGAGNMLSLFPYTDIDISREGYPKLLMAATGPFFGGLLPRMAEGLVQASRGNIVKGAEGFMPNGVSNVLRSARFASDGITKANGDVTLSADELGALDVMAQAFGLPTNKVTDKNFLSSSQYNAEQFYKDKSSELKQRYTKAAKTNDADTMRDLREEWMRVQTTSKEVGIAPQPLQNLLKAPAEQRKREQGTQYGGAYTKKTAGYAPALME